MRFFSPPTPLMLYTNINPDNCALHLRDAIDPERPSYFSFSGYRGSEPFLGEVEGRKFRIFARGYKNTFPPVLTGVLLPNGGGTRVQGSFDLELTSKIAICIIFPLPALAVALVVAYSLKNHSVAPWLAVSFAIAFFVLVFLAPRIIRASGLDEERKIADFLCEKLEASTDPSAFESLNR
jgi:hypothetical protein